MANFFACCIGVFWNRTEGRLRGLWRLVLQMLLMIPLTLAGTAVVLPLFHSLRGLAAARDLSWILQSGFMFAICFAGAAIAARILDRRPLTDFGLRISKVWFLELVFGLALGALMMTGIFLFEWSAGWITITGFFVPTNSHVSFIFSLSCSLISFTLAAFAEEILHRGYQLKNMSESLKIGPLRAGVATFLAVLVSSLLFALNHLGNPNTTWISTVNIGLAGVMLSIAYLVTGRLALPLGVHIAWNVFQGNVFGFPVSGMNFTPRFIAIEQHGDVFVTGGAFGPEAGLVGLAAMLAGTIVMLGWAWLRHKGRIKACAEELATYQRIR